MSIKKQHESECQHKLVGCIEFSRLGLRLNIIHSFGTTLDQEVWVGCTGMLCFPSSPLDGESGPVGLRDSHTCSLLAIPRAFKDATWQPLVIRLLWIFPKFDLWYPSVRGGRTLSFFFFQPAVKQSGLGLGFFVEISVGAFSVSPLILHVSPFRCQLKLALTTLLVCSALESTNNRT